MNDLGPDARSLLDLARSADDPTADARRRVRHALAASVAVGAAVMSTTSAATANATGTTAAAIAGATGSTAIGGKAAVWLGVGLVAGLASTGTLVAVSRANAPQAAVIASASPATRVVAAVEAASTRAVSPAVESPTSPQPPTAREQPAPAPRLTERAPEAASSLAAETALLESARTALGRGDSRTALTLLERHARDFPGGALVEERLASQVFALCGLGRRADAAHAAAELLRRAPASPLRGRVMDSCAFHR